MQLQLEVGIPAQVVTLADYAAAHGVRASAIALADVGKTATALYKRRFGCAPSKIDDGEWGRVNAYPPDLAAEVLRLFGYL